MKITLEIDEGVLCAFLTGVKVCDTGLEMFAHQIGSDDLKDGNTLKLPRDNIFGEG